MLSESAAERSPHITQGVALVVFSPEGKILINHRDAKALVNPNRWSLVTGKLENGELIEECAKREFREETERELDFIKFLYVNTGRNNAYVLLGYTHSLDTNCHEGDGMRFVSLKDLDRYNLISIHKTFIKKAIEELKRIKERNIT